MIAETSSVAPCDLAINSRAKIAYESFCARDQLATQRRWSERCPETMVDGICRIRAREWERAPIDSEQAVNLWVSAVREFIASLVPDTAVHPVKDFIGEACLIVGARLGVR